MNTRRTRSVSVLQMEQPLVMSATASAQLEQKQECQSTWDIARATPERGGPHTHHAVAAAAVTVADCSGIG